MAEVLSQSEIDALLSAVSTGTVETGQTNRPRSDWVVYDLTSHEKVIKSRYVGFQGIHDRFAKTFRTSLSQLLRRNINVTPINTEFMKFGDYISNIVPPISLNTMKMKELSGYMVFVAGSKFVYSFLDTYYGGTERPYNQPASPETFTAIERRLIKKVCGIGMKDLMEGWRLNYPLKLEWVESESTPQSFGFIHHSEVVAIITFDIEFENLSGPINLVVQLKVFDPIHQCLRVNITMDIAKNESQWKEHWLSELPELQLIAKVELGTVEKSVEAMREWKKGDVITLEHDSDEPLTLEINGLSKGRGLMGTFRGNNALRLIELLDKKRG